MTRIGAIFNPYTHTPEEFLPAIRAAEAAGVDEVWVWEDCFRTSGFAAAAAALASTDRLRIGIGIAPMPLRNVVMRRIRSGFDLVAGGYRTLFYKHRA